MHGVSEKQSGPPSADGHDGETTWPGHMADDVGSTYGPEPTATLTATADLLILSGTRGTFRLPRAAVTRLGRGKMYPWFFSALHIRHSVAGYPVNLQFKPLNSRWSDLRDRLETLGYPT